MITALTVFGAMCLAASVLLAMEALARWIWEAVTREGDTVSDCDAGDAAAGDTRVYCRGPW